MEIEFAWYRIVDWWERWRYGDDRDDEANSGDDWEWTPLPSFTGRRYCWARHEAI